MRPIIVEGPDGHGKSFLARQLANYYECALFTCGPAPKDEIALMEYILLQAEAVKAGDVVMDRVTALSQQVYNIVIRNKEHDHLLRNELTAHIKRGAVFVYCNTRHPKMVAEDYDDPAHDEKVKQNLSLLDDVYRMEMIEARVPFIEYDYTVPSAFHNLIEVLNQCQSTNQATSSQNSTQTLRTSAR